MGQVGPGQGQGSLDTWAGGTPTSSVEESGEDLASHAGTLIAVAVGGYGSFLQMTPIFSMKYEASL